MSDKTEIQKHSNKRGNELNFLLFGKPRQGKSATGNSILNTEIFKVSGIRRSETRDVICAVGQFCGFSFKVVDALYLETDGEGKAEGIQEASQRATAVFDKFLGQFDALLFIIKFGHEFTAGDKMAFDALKGSLGDKFIDHVIVVVTCGDLYEAVMKEEDEDGIPFDIWCGEQKGLLLQLYRDCNGRFVLFNNKEMDEEKKMKQVKEIIQLSLRLRTCQGPVVIDRGAVCDQKTNTLTPNLQKSEIRQINEGTICLNEAAIGSNLHREVSDSSTSSMAASKRVMVTEVGENNRGNGLYNDTPIKSTLRNVQMVHKKEEIKLTVLMMGKTGTGKSATGNTILNRRRAFKTSSNVTSETKEVKDSFVEFDHFLLHVVDGPGLIDTDMNSVEDRITVVINMETALGKCYGGVHAFLLVIKFGNRFTEEDSEALQSLKSIFGDHFMDHVIVVMTGGDIFQQANEESEEKISFREWCMTQTGPFRQLYLDCQGRFVLFNNMERDVVKMRQQRLQFVELVHDLQIRCGLYTSELFKQASHDREKMILECRAPQLKLEIQEKISLLTADIEKLYKNPSEMQALLVRSKIGILSSVIDNEDKDYGVLCDMKKLLREVDENLNDVEELHKLAKQLEAARIEHKILTGMSPVGTAAAVGAGILVPSAGVVAAGVAIGASIGVQLKYLFKSRKIKKRMNELEIKRQYQQ